MYANRRTFHVIVEIGVEEHDGDVRVKTVEIRPFRACAMNNMHDKPYLWPNRRNFHIITEIRAKEHDGDVRF